MNICRIVANAFRNWKTYGDVEQFYKLTWCKNLRQFVKLILSEKVTGMNGQIWPPFPSWVDRANKYRSGDDPLVCAARLPPRWALPDVLPEDDADLGVDTVRFRARNDPKSGLASTNFFLPELAFLSKHVFVIICSTFFGIVSVGGSLPTAASASTCVARRAAPLALGYIRCKIL